MRPVVCECGRRCVAFVRGRRRPTRLKNHDCCPACWRRVTDRHRALYLTAPKESS